MFNKKQTAAPIRAGGPKSVPDFRSIMNLTRVADTVCDSILALVYPQSCTVCGASVESRACGVACAECWQQTRIFTETEKICWKCGLPLPGSVPRDEREGVSCRRCDSDYFGAARACGIYEGALRAAVLGLKHTPHVCARLRDLLSEVQLRAPLNRATRIMPVPLHPEREKARGFNQAAIMGRALALRSKLPFNEDCLVRSRHTERHRAGMDAKDRRLTVEDAFQVSYPALITGHRILLIDDVFTTGATVSSCAKSLLAAGAAEVLVLTIARPERY